MYILLPYFNGNESNCFKIKYYNIFLKNFSKNDMKTHTTYNILFVSFHCRHGIFNDDFIHVTYLISLYLYYNILLFVTIVLVGWTIINENFSFFFFLFRLNKSKCTSKFINNGRKCWNNLKEKVIIAIVIIVINKNVEIIIKSKCIALDTPSDF